MSAIGKTFIVLNLVFSLVIVGAAASYLSKADDFKKAYNKEHDAFTKAQQAWTQTKSDLEARIRNLQTESDEKQSKIDDLAVANSNLKDTNKSKDVANQQLRDAVDQIKNTLNDFRQNMNDLSNRNNELTDANAKLRNAALDSQTKQKQAEEDQLRVEGELKRANDRISSLELASANLQKEKGHLQSLLKIAESKGFDISSLVAMRKIDAAVVDVDNDLGFVVLSVGKDSQVEKGWTFQIYRDEKYLGEVEVDEVYDKYSAARIKFRAEGAEFKIHDSATTVL